MLNDTLPRTHTGTIVDANFQVPNTSEPLSTLGADSTPWYRRERWLVVCLASVVPVVVAIYAPQAWKMPLAIAGGLIMSASMLMLVRHQREAETRESGKAGMSHTGRTPKR